MPRPLTPAQVEALEREYLLTGSTAEAARRVGVPERTAHHRLTLADRRRLHARACERGERAARAALLRQVERLEAMLEACTDPKGAESLVRALAVIAQRTESLRNSIDTRATARLQRESMRRAAKAETGESAPSVPLPAELATPRGDGA